jgi:hypothetical protein
MVFPERELADERGAAVILSPQFKATPLPQFAVLQSSRKLTASVGKACMKVRYSFMEMGLVLADFIDTLGVDPKGNVRLIDWQGWYTKEDYIKNWDTPVWKAAVQRKMDEFGKCLIQIGMEAGGGQLT